MSELAEKMIDFARLMKAPGVVVLRDIGVDGNGFAIGGSREYEKWIVGFNLKIVDQSGEEMVADEWCPKLKVFVPIKRKMHVRARYTDIHGKTDTQVYGGITARLLQQALDRINGIRISSLCSSYHREKALKEMKLAQRNQKRVLDKVT